MKEDTLEEFKKKNLLSTTENCENFTFQETNLEFKSYT